MKKILVPCDFSAQSHEAYKVATDLATRAKGEILLLHVLTVPSLYDTSYTGDPLFSDPQYLNRLEQDTRQELEKMKGQVSDKSIKVTTEVVYGNLVALAKNMIEERNIDLVVMGTSGASGFTEFFIGSNTEKMVRFSPVPVLAIRKAVDLKSVKNILLPSTLDLNQTNFIKKLTDLQQFFNATLHILLINTPVHFRRAAEGNEALEEFVKHYKLSNCKIHFRNNDHEDEGIMEFVNSEHMDLIVMATHARKGLAHLFNDSLTEKVVNHIQIPIWTYHLNKG
jgi:nucleotide-binding universal stress UspA family protein